MTEQPDTSYWLAREEAVIPHLVDLADFGFLIDHDCHQQGWTDEVGRESR